MNELTYGDYRECDGCSRGMHINHVPVACDCGICKPQEHS